MGTETALLERQEGESERAFEAWKAYRDMDAPRSVARLARSGVCAPLTIHGLKKASAAFAWKKRALAWDNRVNAAEVDATLDEVSKLRKKHLDQLELIRRRGLQLMVHSKRADARAGQQMYEMALKYELLLLGQVTDRTEQVESVDYGKLSLDELRTLRDLEAKARGEK